MTLQETLFQPSSEWTPPDKFPNLSGEKIIGLDTETFDPNLMEMGPGGARNDGQVVGVSLATERGDKWYFPIRHLGGGNMDMDKVKQFLSDQLSSSIPKVGANIIYDLEWLQHEGIKVQGPFYDVQIAEPLLNENKKSYSLENLSLDYLNRGKEEGKLIDAAKSFGLDPKKELWKLPAKFVGPYAEEDAFLPIRIWKLQQEKIIKKDLQEIQKLEHDLIPVLLDMRFKGVRIDEDRTVQLNDKLIKEEFKLAKELRKEAGFNINPWSNKHCMKAMDEHNISYGLTEKGNASFSGEWLKNHEHPLPQKISAFRRTNKMRRDFVEGCIMKYNFNGRIHGQFHQLRKDSFGTRSGRFSSSNPNLQQIPARDPYWGALIRGLYIPDEGCKWGRFDYSQQEPRVLLHYAEELGLPGAFEAGTAYREKPETDYHSLTQDEINKHGTSIDRFQAKTLNLGMAYRMAREKLATLLKVKVSLAGEILEAYHESKPYVAKLAESCEKRARTKGYIKTLLGRHRHYGPGTNPYQAGNGLIQGSSADITKRAMLDCYSAGYTAHIQVHDELDFSLDKPKKQVKEITEIMNNCVKMNVPLMTDAIIGDNWGECK